jgi:hypothetical protein
MNNKQRYDLYYETIKAATDKYLKAQFSDELPPSFFEVNRTVIAEKNITGLHYFLKGFHKIEKPTRKEVAEIKALSENMPSFSIENVHVDYTEQHAGYKVSGAKGLSEIINDLRFSLDASNLQEQLAANQEKYTLKDGDFACAYCGRAWPIKDAVRDVVISRTYASTGMRKEFDYCSKQCADYNQMAHEG